MSVALHHGDCRDRMRELPDASVDAIVTDPPYGLSFMGKKWDYDVPREDVWRECLRVLKPGGHLVCFAGTRTQHRMAVRIEDAGFEIRDMLAWLYGSGFPKSMNVSAAIDRNLGAERTEVLYERSGVTKTFNVGAQATVGPRAPATATATAPATAPATAYDGWGTALKPSLEPITLARKPLIGTVAANVLQHGTGALNIDGCRVAYAGTEDAAAAAAEIRGRQTSRNFEGWGMQSQDIDREAYLQGPAGLGRWPANIAHDGSPEVVALFPSEAGQAAPLNTRNSDKTRNTYGAFAGTVDAAFAPHDGIGSAARFFYCAKATQEDRNEGCAGLPERTGGMVSNTGGQHITRRDGGAPGPRANHHPTVKPTDLMRWLCRLITPRGGVILDPFMGSGSTGKAAVLEGFGFIGIDLTPEYVEIARARIEFAKRMGHQPSLLAEVEA